MLLLQYYDRLVRHIQRQLPTGLRGLLHPEDILQQTYVKAFSNILKFEPKSEHSFYSWLKTIADRQLLDAQRRRQRERRAKKGSKKTSDTWASTLLDQIAANTSTIGRGARRKEAINALQVAVASLPEDYRQVVQLRFIEERSLAEVAEEMDRTEDAVRGLIHRAKKKLRDMLGRSSVSWS
jgi:RNA polymerase sigma-70 factor (ECF subfamily)